MDAWRYDSNATDDSSAKKLNLDNVAKEIYRKQSWFPYEEIEICVFPWAYGC